MKRWIYIVLICIFAVTFLVSGYYIVDYVLESRQTQNTYSELSQLVEDARQEITEPSQPEQEDVSEPSRYYPCEDVIHPVTGETVRVLKDYVKVFLANPDTVGWIRIEDTRINYPVMQTPDNPNYYLNLDFNKKYGIHGCIYAKEECDIFKPSDNITMFGHRLYDNTMFTDLHKYKKQEFWEEHRYIIFDTLSEYHTYEIMSVFLLSSTALTPFPYHQFIDAETPQQFEAFVTLCHSYELYDTGVDAQYGDKLISLSTCEYSNVNGRLVVVAKRID